MSKHQCKTWSGRVGTDFRYAHYKRDGIWLEIVGVGKHLNALSSQETDLTHQVEHTHWWQKLLRLASDGEQVLLYGELWVPGQPASYVKSALAKGEHCLQYDVFAIGDLPAHTPLGVVATVAATLGQSTAPYLRRRRDYDSIDQLMNKALPNDTEGYVFKNANLLDWHKWKKQQTIDCVVTGFVDGRGKYLGLTGALLCSVYHHGCGNEPVEIANASGMSDKERIYISADEDAYLGKVCEIEYQYVGSNGRLRHPRFKRWREDKIAGECTSDQDPMLKEKLDARR